MKKVEVKKQLSYKLDELLKHFPKENRSININEISLIKDIVLLFNSLYKEVNYSYSESMLFLSLITYRKIWQDQENYRFTAFVVGQQALLAAGHQDAAPQQSKLLAIDIETGATLWSIDLPASVVKSGLTMDSNGSIYAALENGELHCWKVTN